MPPIIAQSAIAQSARPSLNGRWEESWVSLVLSEAGGVPIAAHSENHDCPISEALCPSLR